MNSAPRDTQKRPPPVVLIVDDEAVVTQSLAAFLEFETSYEVLQFQSPHEALEHIRQRPVDLVVSDFLMPRMNGLQFLAEVKKVYPDVPRIMLTGYADKENAIRAINEVGLFQYMEKPWDNDQLKLVIDNAITNKSLRENLETRIRELDVTLLERDKLAQRDVRIREELMLARRLQESMLPDQLTGANGISFTAQYLPALDIGGDFYDVVPLTADRVAVLVADATGHGIQAALSTAILKFAFTRYANCDTTAAEILKGMNGVLRRGLPADVFVAALIAVVDMTTAECRVTNAGLPHPVVLRRGAREAERVAANGFMLGIIDDELYHPEEETVVQLGRNDLLLLYTDGVGEVENNDGEHFDTVGLCETLLANAATSSADLAGALVQECRKHSREGHEWDDITIVGIELE